MFKYESNDMWTNVLVEHDSYNICETTVINTSSDYQILQEATVVNKNGLNVPVVRAIVTLQRFGVRNWNGRIYPMEVVMDAIRRDPNIQHDMSMKAWVGEAGHPDPSLGARRMATFPPSNTSHTILKVWTEGDLLKGEIMTLPSEQGISMANTMILGIPVAFSLRAQGKTDSNNIIVPPLKVLCYDWVWRPSHKEAYSDTVNSLTESVAASDFSHEYTESALCESVSPVDEKLTDDEIKSIRTPALQVLSNLFEGTECIKVTKKSFILENKDGEVSHSLTINQAIGFTMDKLLFPEGM